MKRAIVRCVLAGILGAASHAYADTPWGTQDYDLYAGDFDGDGLSDVLYIAHDASRLSGIALSVGSGFSVPLQSWDNTYLGIPWTSGDYRIVVADFNGDGKDDLFLQRRTPGDHYLLLTEERGVGAISQAIPNDAVGLAWSLDAHRIIAGNFNGDGRADLYLQPADKKGLSAIVLADASGQFTASVPAQQWGDGYAGFNWSVVDANVFAGDFNGDGRDELLLQAKPLPGTGLGTKTMAVFSPNMNGAVLASEGKQIFATEGVQAWSEDGFAAQWSPLRSAVVVADFNGDQRADVLLQGLKSTDPSYLLQGRVTGAIFELAATFDNKALPSADQRHLIAGHFTGREADGLYFQALEASQSNYVATIGPTGSSVVIPDAVVATKPDEQVSSDVGSLSEAPVGARGMAAAAMTATSAGRTRGQFAVSNSGSATYQIPIWTPPGARGIQPHLALTYASGSSDGPLGPGWNLSGLSSIARCPKTYASNGGLPVQVALLTSDDVCLDGNRLRLTSGTPLTAGAEYQTELADFSRVKAYGAAGNGPSYFVVEAKNGLNYVYGSTTDSKAYGSGGSTPYAWMLNKITDRQQNNLKITYSTTSGDIQPSSIEYTQTALLGPYPYKVSFTYKTRLTPLSKYIGGQNIQQTKVLSKIDVQSSGTSVRQYILEYEAATTTERDRLKLIQECGGSAGTDCLRPTIISYQNGTAGIAAPTFSAVSTTIGYADAVDVDADGRTDLVYATGSATSAHWYVQFANASGGYGSAVDTGLITTAADQTLFGDFYGDGRSDIVGPVAGSWTVARWNGTGFTIASSGTSVDSTSTSNVLADTDGDGRADLVTRRTDNRIYIRRNVSSGVAPAFAAATAAFGPASTPTFLYSDFHYRGGSGVPTADGFAGARILDLNGDGRQDIVGYYLYLDTQTLTLKVIYVALLANGSTFSTSASYPAGENLVGFANINNDACTDLIFRTKVRVSACNGTATTDIALTGTPIGALDWDGDGRDDLLADIGGVINIERSVGNALATPVSTGISRLSSQYYYKTDSNGDRLDDLAVINTASGNAIAYGLHNGANTPADFATKIEDGWGISASPTYVSITQNNYTKRSDAIFPAMDYQAPLYVVSQTQQSDGRGNTYPTTYWYEGAWLDRQGRGFQGFYKVRTQDSRNSLYGYTYFKREYPYTGMVAQKDLFQADNLTLISRTVNGLDVKDLAASGCTSAGTSATSRCFPYVIKETVTQKEITAGAPLIQTAITDFVYDTYGNPTSVTTTTTDNDSSSPYYPGSWVSTLTNIYVNDVTNWCLGLPTQSTLANTVPNQPSATRRVDHTVDVVACRFDTETIEPSDQKLKVVTTFSYLPTTGCGNLMSQSVVGLDETKTPAAMPPRVTSFAYGTRCTFPESITNAENETTLIGYNYAYGLKSSVTDPNGAAVSWTYDNFGRPVGEFRPDTTQTVWEYSDCVSTSCWGVGDLRSLIIERQYDSAPALVRLQYRYFDGLERLRYDQGHRALGVWTGTLIAYNSMGLKEYIYQPYSSASNGYHRFDYDLLNRPTADTLYNASGAPDGVTTVAYSGLKRTITDPKGKETQRWMDVTGALRQIIDPSPDGTTPGGTTNYRYDPFGNLIEMVDATAPTGAITSYTYNIRGFRTGSNDPDTGNWTFTPNSLNELVEQRDAENQTISFGYDKVGRLTSRFEPESPTPTTWTYGSNPALHEIGSLKSVSKPDGYAENYTFDAIGRPASATYIEDTTYQVNYTYNSIGTLDTLTYPTSTSGVRFALKFGYSYGELQQVKDNASSTVFWSLSASNDYSSPTTEILGTAPNSVTVTSEYKAWTNYLTKRQVGSGGPLNNLRSLAYGWDVNGNLEQRQDLTVPGQTLTEGFTPDELNRVKSSTLNGTQNLSMDYNAAGNVMLKDSASFNYTTNQAGCTYTPGLLQPHAVRKAGATVYCYNKNGNIIARGGSAITWYSYNQPKKINSGTNSTEFSYNANYQRWKQVAIDSGATTTTFYVGGLLEKVIRPDGVIEYRHMIPAGSSVAQVTRRSDLTVSTYYITTDHLGSTDLILDSGGAVKVRESFSAFGERRGSNWQGTPSPTDKTFFASITRRGFTGHEMLDAVNLIHMNGRVYDPLNGRFLSADPLIASPGLSQNHNRYSYVMNNPLSRIDPSGYKCLLLRTSDPECDGSSGSDGTDGNTTVEEVVVPSTHYHTPPPITPYVLPSNPYPTFASLAVPQLQIDARLSGSQTSQPDPCAAVAPTSNGLDPRVQAKADALMEQIRQKNLSARLGQTRRTVAQQNQIYAQGRTTPGSQVSGLPGGYSLHNYGLAFDILMFTPGGAYIGNGSDPAYQTAGGLGEGVDLDWGGRWSNPYDPSHFQFTDGLTIDEIRANYKAGRDVLCHNVH